MNKFNRFEVPYYEKPDDNIPEINDILTLGMEADVFKLKREVLTKKIPVNVSDNENNNLFHLILNNELKKTQTNIVNFLKYLVENNTNPDQPNKNNRTPLHYACMNHYNIIISYLLSIGCNPNFKDDFGMTPMHYLMGGKIKVYKNKEAKPIKRNKENTDILKNQQLVKLQTDIFKMINGKYKDYMSFFKKIIGEIVVDKPTVSKVVKILDKNVDTVMSAEDRETEMMNRMKDIRNIFESKILQTFDINSMKLESSIKEKEDDDNIFPNNDFYILDNFSLGDNKDEFKNLLINKVAEKMSQIIENLEDKIEGFFNKIYNDTDFSYIGSASGNLILKENDVNLGTLLIGGIDDGTGLNGDKENDLKIISANFMNKILALFNELFNKLAEIITNDDRQDTIIDDIKNIARLQDYSGIITDDITKIINDTIKFINEINMLRFMYDFLYDGNINVDIPSFFNNIIPYMKYEKNPEDANENIDGFFIITGNIDDSMEYFGNTDRDFSNDNNIYSELNVKENNNNYIMNYTDIDASNMNIPLIVNMEKNNITVLVKQFMKKVIENEINKEPYKTTINTIYQNTIINNNIIGNIDDLNKNKIFINMVETVVRNYLSNMVNNKVNKLTIGSLSRGELTTDASSLETNPILNIVNNDNIVYNFDIDLNDGNFNLEPKDDIDKRFIMFSDDYSTLQIEKELLELKIDNNTMKNMLEHGGTLTEIDGNGRLPLDNIIDNRYYCIVNDYKTYGIEQYNIKDMNNNLKYCLNILKNHITSYDFNKFTENQYRDLKELIESNDEYNYTMYKETERAFKMVDYHVRKMLNKKNRLFIKITNYDRIVFNNDIVNLQSILLEQYNMKEINTLADKIKLITEPLNNLEIRYNNCINYFTGSKYYGMNKMKKILHDLLKQMGNGFILPQIKKFISTIIAKYYKINAGKEIKVEDIENIFSAGTVYKKSYNDNLKDIIELFINNACDLYEDVDEKDSSNYMSASDLLNNFIDTIPMNEYVSIKADSKLIEVIKRMTIDYFDTFVYRMIQNWMIVYENNLKFIINHYRILKIIDSITS